MTKIYTENVLSRKSSSLIAMLYAYNIILYSAILTVIYEIDHFKSFVDSFVAVCSASLLLLAMVLMGVLT